MSDRIAVTYHIHQDKPVNNYNYEVNSFVSVRDVEVNSKTEFGLGKFI